MKRCPDCRQLKPASAFSRNSARPDGLQFYCKECYAERSARTYRDRQRRKGRTVRERVVAPPGSKYCPGCETISPHDNWHRNSTSNDGYASYCKPCRAERAQREHLERTFGLTLDQHAAMLRA